MLKLDGELARGRARRDPSGLRRRRPAAVGDGEDGAVGAGRARVRDQHPRHGRRRGADERERLRRPARAGARVGRRLHARGRRAPPAGPARLRLPPLEPGAGGGRLARLVRARRGRPGGDQGDPRRDARQAPRGTALRHQDLRLDLQEPRRPARRGAHRRPAAGGGRLPRPPGRRRPVLGQARELRREHGHGDDRRRARPHGRGPPPRARALRDRPRAGGPDPGRGRVARELAPRSDPDSASIQAGGRPRTPRT